MRFYDSLTQALHRVERLINEAGTWPGVVGPDRDGQYRLTYDPQLTGAQGPANTGAPRPEAESSSRSRLTQAELEAELEAGPHDEAEYFEWLQDQQREVPDADAISSSGLAEAEFEAGLADEAEADWGR